MFQGSVGIFLDYGRKGKMEISIFQTWPASLPSTIASSATGGPRASPPRIRIHEKMIDFPHLFCG